MTDREKAIVMAYTGYCMLAGDKLSVFYEYIESIMGRPVYTHEMGTEVVANLIKGKARPDFIALCADEISSEKPNKWIACSDRLPELNRPLLVTAYHRVYYGYLISKSGNFGYPVFRIHGLSDKNRNWVQETMSHEPGSSRRIDAWMYLDIPEPYKQEVKNG